MIAFSCAVCSRTIPADPSRWRCPECGGNLSLPPRPFAPPPAAPPAPPTLWRYRASLPLDGEPVSLGEGGTPLLPGRVGSAAVLFKCEQRSPTGSFKDRGASVLVSWLRERGVRRVVEDSSGNAGVALAAYAARAGIEAEIYVPEDASPSQRERIRNLGARVVAVPGERARAAEAAREAARGCAYASHVHQPHFLAGTKTIAYEIWEQTRGAPPAVVALPVGNGSLLLGLAMGFEEIARAGLPGSAPRIAAYQTDRCAPLARAFAACGDAVDPVRPAPTRARGIAVAQPPRGTEILAAVRRSGGWITAVPEERIGPALREMALRGILLEWTSAVVLAGLEEDLGRRVIPGPIVAVLTAGGFQDLRAEASRPPT